MKEARKIMIFFLIIVFLCSQGVNSQNTYTKKSQFSLGDNVAKAKYSPDYTLLAVIRTNDPRIYSYNPFTFEPLGQGYFDLGDGLIPIDLQLFGLDVHVVTSSNHYRIYQRKVGSSGMIFKQQAPVKLLGDLVGIKIQKLKKDFEADVNMSSPRNVVIWRKKNFEVFKYTPLGNTNKVAPLFNKTFDATNEVLTDLQFYDDKYLVYGLQKSDTVGQTNLFEYANPTKSTTVNTKHALEMKSFAIKPYQASSYSHYLSITYPTEVNQFRPTTNSISPDKTPLASDVPNAKIIYDGDRLLGLYNPSSIYVYNDTQTAVIDNFPSFKEKFSEKVKQGQPSISMALMPQNVTGQLIIGKCAGNPDQNCFSYYSLCDIGYEYQITKGTGGRRKEECRKCTNDTNCEKCFGTSCVKCKAGYFLGAGNKCTQCKEGINGCVSCSQDGKKCQTCDKSAYDEKPLNNVCQCIAGTVWDFDVKTCKTCASKIEFCVSCTSSQPNNYYCGKCQPNIHRIVNQNSSRCVCEIGYFQNGQKTCQICDNFQKCLDCVSETQCNTCNDKDNWVLSQGKCVCKDNFIEVENKCYLCDILGCKTCKTNVTCQQCQQGFRLDPQSQVCVCNADRFLNTTSSKCELCSDYLTDCVQCPDSTKCSSCDESKHRNLAPNSEGKCTCQATYTQNSQKVCKLCTLPGCLNCQDDNVCSKCNTENGFNETIQTGKCKCLDTKYLDTDTSKCLECSQKIFGCQGCSDNTTCTTCNKTASFDPTPINGSCKCLQDYYVSNNQCLQCQVICEHCQKCIEIVSGDENVLKSTTIGCSKCDDEYQVQDSLCIPKKSNAVLWILLGIGLLTLAIVLFVCYIIRRRKRKEEEESRKSMQHNKSMVSLLLKDSDPDVITTDRTQIASKKNYEPLFSGNINYSISSQERQSDKKSFNDSLKQIQRERQSQYERKQLQKKTSGSQYQNLSKNMKGVKKQQSQEQQQEKKKQSLFSHRGKG